MATGDNVLTAISVGRQCNIIDPESEVFLGDVRKQGNRDIVFWKSTKADGHKIMGATLQPDEQFFKDETNKVGYNSLVKSELDNSKAENERSVNDIVNL